jgi:CDP-alcohol phosphatidyltransferase
VKDVWLDQVLHRRLSRPLSAGAVRIGIAPNAVTIASLLVGLGAAWSVARGSVAGAWLGLALYLAAVVLDHADGEVARATGTASRLGHWLDIGTDAAVHAALVVALGSTMAPLGESWGPSVGVVGAMGVVACAIVANVWPLRTTADGSRVERWLDGLGNRHGFYGALLGYVLGRTFIPGLLPTLLIVVTLGAHAYWLGRVALLLARRRKPGPEVAAGAGGRRSGVQPASHPAGSWLSPGPRDGARGAPSLTHARRRPSSRRPGAGEA